MRPRNTSEYTLRPIVYNALLPRTAEPVNDSTPLVDKAAELTTPEARMFVTVAVPAVSPLTLMLAEVMTPLVDKPTAVAVPDSRTLVAVTSPTVTEPLEDKPPAVIIPAVENPPEMVNDEVERPEEAMTCDADKVADDTAAAVTTPLVLRPLAPAVKAAALTDEPLRL